MKCLHGETQDPIEFIKILTKELIEDATNILDFTILPDEFGYSTLDARYKAKFG